MRITFTAAMILAIWTGNVVGAPPDGRTIFAEISDNVSTEYAECSAYFAVVYRAMEVSSRPADAARFKAVSAQALSYAIAAAKESRSEKMAIEVSLARVQVDLQEMQKSIENNVSNISILMSKYNESCVEAMNSFSSVLDRWTRKITSKYDKSSPPTK